MGLRFTASTYTGGDFYNNMVFDDPLKKVVYYVTSGNIRTETGFRITSVTGVTIPKSALFFWYRFTNDGMLLGYYANTSNLSVSVPSEPNTYYTIFYFSFANYQMKMFVDCLDFKTYCENNFPYLFDYSGASDEEKKKRVWNLEKLQCLEFKAFKEKTVASIFCLPYTFFNTYKFDFEHVMYNRDGSLKPAAKWYPSMFVDGGELIPRYYPQPTTITN